MTEFDAFDEQADAITDEDRQAAISAGLLAGAGAVASQYVYNNSLLRWQDANTGRMVAEDVVVSQMRRHVAATFDTLEMLTEQLYDGRISVQQWQTAVASELKDAHLAQAMFARGGKHNMTAAEFGRIGGTLRDEYGYLANFADDIASERVSRAQALARIKQYGKASQQSYWREWQLASPEKIHWNLNPSEHCTGCIDLAANSPYTAETLPTVPGAGATPCRGNCNCTLSRSAA